MYTKDMGQSKVEVVHGQKPIPAKVIADSLVEMAAAWRQVNDTRLTRKALVTLIHAHSKVPKGQIELVLNNLDQLERLWLKPATQLAHRLTG